ncbi:MAG: DUF4271 domain-containing protein [Chitinophagaceae bacterium]|nr:DUF4271 domain-containing protein [Chitinophagaceae bacterium]
MHSQTDTLRDSDKLLVHQPDSINKISLVFKNWDSVLYSKHPFCRFTNPTRLITTKKSWKGKEPFFYVIVGLLVFFALIRNGFSRYLHDMFRLFFRTTLKQRQIKEQLMQAPLPSFLLNILFVLSGGMFICLLFQYYNLGTQYRFWILLFFCIAGLASIYSIKYVALKVCGWLFRLSEATDAYSFIVFTTNRIIGIAVLPFIILLAFSGAASQKVIVNFALLILIALFLYRYFLSYSSVRKQVKINFFHFLLYLAAFELIPLLLINKLLFRFLTENY